MTMTTTTEAFTVPFTFEGFDRLVTGLHAATVADYDCGADRYQLTDEEFLNQLDGAEYERVPVSEYECLQGRAGTGNACTVCEMHMAQWQLEQAEAALTLAGVSRPFPWATMR